MKNNYREKFVTLEQDVLKAIFDIMSNVKGNRIDFINGGEIDMDTISGELREDGSCVRIAGVVWDVDAIQYKDGKIIISISQNHNNNYITIRYISGAYYTTLKLHELIDILETIEE